MKKILISILSLSLFVTTFAIKSNKNHKNKIIIKKKIIHKYKRKEIKKLSGSLLLKINSINPINSEIVKFAPKKGSFINLNFKSTYRGRTAQHPDFASATNIGYSHGLGNGIALTANAQFIDKGPFQNGSAYLQSDQKFLYPHINNIQGNINQEPFAIRKKIGFGFEDTLSSNLQTGLDFSFLNNNSYNSSSTTYNHNDNGIVNGYEINPYIQMKLKNSDYIFMQGYSRTIVQNNGSFSSYNSDKGMNNSKKGQMWSLFLQYNHKLTKQLLANSSVKYQIANTRYSELQRYTNASEDDLGDQIQLIPFGLNYELYNHTILRLFSQIEINNFRKSNQEFKDGNVIDYGYNANLAIIPQIEQDYLLGPITIYLIGELKIKNTYITNPTGFYAPDKNLHWNLKGTLGFDCTL